ncbi:hypothetical protein ACJX0J_010980, partial [Zea mays]
MRVKYRNLGLSPVNLTGRYQLQIFFFFHREKPHYNIIVAGDAAAPALIIRLY